jgi:hypothetical protein
MAAQVQSPRQAAKKSDSESVPVVHSRFRLTANRDADSMRPETEPAMSDRHLLHEFMTGKSHADSTRRERQIQTFIQLGIGAMVVLAIGLFFI